MSTITLTLTVNITFDAPLHREHVLRYNAEAAIRHAMESGHFTEGLPEVEVIVWYNNIRSTQA